MIFVTIFGRTFTVNVHPTWVFYLILKFTQKWGTNLDTRAPVCVRIKALKACRRFATPNTPF